MTRLRPALATSEDERLWERVLRAAGARELRNDELREAVLGTAVRTLRTHLGDDIGLRALGEAAQNDEDTDQWLGAQFQARQLGFADAVTTSIMFLMSVKTTSDEAESRYFRASAAATAVAFGRPAPGMDEPTAQLYDRHGAALIRFIEAQHELTARLLKGVDEVTLHRGSKEPEPIASSEFQPALWPLASFSTRPSSALTLGSRSRQPGELVLLSAVVPVDRILATPATGAAVVLEHEAVIAVGEAADRVTLTRT